MKIGRIKRGPGKYGMDAARLTVPFEAAVGSGFGTPSRGRKGVVQVDIGMYGDGSIWTRAVVVKADKTTDA